MNQPEQPKIKLTEYSRGAGCGCKIAPKALKEIIGNSLAAPGDNLLVGNDHHDDAAVYDLGNGTALIATTDFFMPIIDDAHSFGKVAAANAISDVYAMGGKPLIAVAILGWPQKLPASEAAAVLEGAREICRQANISLAGGHSIESEEPFFGLAVNGIVNIDNLKRNNTAKEGDLIFITKPIGIGILSTAQKRKVIEEKDVQVLVDELTKLNNIGQLLGEVRGVNAMTDVTGFGLAGHLLEMAEGSGLSAVINYSDVPVYKESLYYLKQKTIPDATYRNWQSYGNKIDFAKEIDVMEAFSILPDPQTNGGLMIAVSPESAGEVKKIFEVHHLAEYAQPIGQMIAKDEKVIYVK